MNDLSASATMIDGVVSKNKAVAEECSEMVNRLAENSNNLQSIVSK